MANSFGAEALTILKLPPLVAGIVCEGLPLESASTAPASSVQPPSQEGQ
jgi:hypothetical protein